MLVGSFRTGRARFRAKRLALVQVAHPRVHREAAPRELERDRAAEPASGPGDERGAFRLHFAIRDTGDAPSSRTLRCAIRHAPCVRANRSA